MPAGAPEGLERMAADPPEPLEIDATDVARRDGDKLEAETLDFLLGRGGALQYDVPVKLDTPSGRKVLTFHIHQLDGHTILQLEKDHRKGSGPFAELDDIRFNAALVAAATMWIADESGAKVQVDSPEFVGDVRDPAIAMEQRFRYQPGLLDGVAGQIRSISGYSPDRVESAERSVVNAAGN